MNRLRMAGAAVVVALCASAGPASAAVYDWELSPDEQFRMWIPDDLDVVYGLYVIWNESSGDTRVLAERPVIQAWARTFGFGIVGTQLPDPGYASTLLDALAAWADMSGHPEIEHVPVLCEGLSLGGYSAMEFAATYPERTIGYLSGGSRRLYEDTSAPGFAKVPGLLYQGEEDPDLESALERKAEVIALRQAGIQIAYFTQWTTAGCPAPGCSGHARGYADEIGWKFLADAVHLRYPEDQNPVAGPVALIDIPDDIGWLADHGTWEDEITAVHAASAFPGDPEAEAFWLPTRDAAYAYRAHATQNGPVSFVEPTDSVQWVQVEPGDVVPIEVSVGPLANVTSVEVFDGSQLIATLAEPPYTAEWMAEGIGAHSLVAVANLGDGTLRTGYIAPVLVTGFEAPGGGSLDPMNPDGGAPGGSDGGGSGGGGGGGGGATDGGGGDGGCGCRSASSPAGALGSALPLLLLALAFSRRRSASGREQ